MSKCWYCDNELTSGDNPKHFGICNKCYDEMFKSGEQKYVDMLYKENSELLVNSLVEKDRQIVELQKQLEEKEKKIRQLDNEKGVLPNNSMKLLKEKDDKLKAQPKEIVEKIRKEVEKEKDENDLAWVGFKRLDRILDTILKEYQKEK